MRKHRLPLLDELYVYFTILDKIERFIFIRGAM